jgi:hypothetical protein
VCEGWWLGDKEWGGGGGGKKWRRENSLRTELAVSCGTLRVPPTKIRARIYIAIKFIHLRGTFYIQVPT